MIRIALAITVAGAVGAILVRRLCRECPHCGDRYCPVYFAGVE